MAKIKKALQALSKEIDNQMSVEMVKIIITLKEEKPSKAKKDDK